MTGIEPAIAENAPIQNVSLPDTTIKPTSTDNHSFVTELTTHRVVTDPPDTVVMSIAKEDSEEPSRLHRAEQPSALKPAEQDLEQPSRRHVDERADTAVEPQSTPTSDRQHVDESATTAGQPQSMPASDPEPYAAMVRETPVDSENFEPSLATVDPATDLVPVPSRQSVPDGCSLLVETINNARNAIITSGDYSRISNRLSNAIKNSRNDSDEQFPLWQTDPEEAMQHATAAYCKDLDREIGKLERSIGPWLKHPKKRREIDVKIRQLQEQRANAIIENDLIIRVEAQMMLHDGIKAIAYTGGRSRSFSVILSDASLVDPQTQLPIFEVGKDWVEENFHDVYVDAVRRKANHSSFFVTNKSLTGIEPRLGFCTTTETDSYWNSLPASEGPRMLPDDQRHHPTNRSTRMVEIKSVVAVFKMNDPREARREAIIDHCVMAVIPKLPSDHNEVRVSYDYVSQYGFVADYGEATKQLSHGTDQTGWYRQPLKRNNGNRKSLCYTIDSNEVHAVRWCDKTNQFEGLVYDVRLLNPEPRHTQRVALDDDWMAENFTNEQICLFKENGVKKRKFIHVPPGAVSRIVRRASSSNLIGSLVAGQKHPCCAGCKASNQCVFIARWHLSSTTLVRVQLASRCMRKD